MLNLKVCIEPHKGYPRDTLARGRVRVLFKDDDGQMQHDTILTKKALLNKICDLIPKLGNRDGYEKKKDDLELEEEKQTKEQKAEQEGLQKETDKDTKKDKKKKKNKRKR